MYFYKYKLGTLSVLSTENNFKHSLFDSMNKYEMGAGPEC